MKKLTEEEKQKLKEKIQEASADRTDRILGAAGDRATLARMDVGTAEDGQRLRKVFALWPSDRDAQEVDLWSLRRLWRFRKACADFWASDGEESRQRLRKAFADSWTSGGHAPIKYTPEKSSPMGTVITRSRGRELLEEKQERKKRTGSGPGLRKMELTAEEKKELLSKIRGAHD